MAGDIRTKERAIVTLSASGGSLASGSAGASATDLDARSTGNFPDDFAARFEFVCQWATVTGLTGGVIAAELYLVPKVDGTNLPDVDTTAGASRLPYSTLVATFELQKTPTSNTNTRFVSGPVQFDPLAYTPYVLNRSGQVMSAGWTLKAVGVQGQYT